MAMSRHWGFGRTKACPDQSPRRCQLQRHRHRHRGDAHDESTRGRLRVSSIPWPRPAGPILEWRRMECRERRLGSAGVDQLIWVRILLGRQKSCKFICLQNVHSTRRRLGQYLRRANCRNSGTEQRAVLKRGPDHWVVFRAVFSTRSFIAPRWASINDTCLLRS